MLRYVGITILSNLTLMLIGHNFRKYKLLKTKYIHLPVDRVFQVASVVKNPPVNAGDGRDMSLIPGLGRCPGIGKSSPPQYSCLENSIERGV